MPPQLHVLVEQQIVAQRHLEHAPAKSTARRHRCRIDLRQLGEKPVVAGDLRGIVGGAVRAEQRVVRVDPDRRRGDRIGTKRRREVLPRQRRVPYVEVASGGRRSSRFR